MSSSMPKKHSHCLLIDPTNPKHSEIIQSIYKHYVFSSPKLKILYSLTQLRISDTAGNRINVYLTHDMFPFKKQTSSADYLMTTDLENVTFGGYGGTADIFNSWKFTQDTPAEFKIKPNRKKRMLKLSNGNHMSKYFNLEQMIGKHTPHMGTTHPINKISGRLLLLMRKQPGNTLQFIIEQSNKNPNTLKTIDYLKLTVNLLIALKTQVHNIEISNEGHIIHGDIKPLNIMVSKRYHVKIIDYGLASTEKNRRKRITGTQGYIDPFYAKNLNLLCDEHSDLASMGITLQKLWMISNYCIKNISDLTFEEKNYIQWLLLNMTLNDRQQRLKYETILTYFKELLKLKKAEYEARLKDIEALWDNNRLFRLLNNDQLLALLKSKYAQSILPANKSWGRDVKSLGQDVSVLKAPDRLSYLVEKLNIELFELSSKTLNWLKKKGMIIPESSRLIQSWLINQVDISVLKKAIKFGAKVYKEDLIYLLEQLPTMKQSYGIAILRLFYENMPEESRDIAFIHANIQLPFYTHFHRLLLKTPREYDCNTELD